MALKVLVSIISAPASKVGSVNSFNDLWLGNAQKIIVAFDFFMKIPEAFATVIFFLEFVTLDHGSIAPSRIKMRCLRSDSSLVLSFIQFGHDHLSGRKIQQNAFDNGPDQIAPSLW